MQRLRRNNTTFYNSVVALSLPVLLYDSNFAFILKLCT
jgi:hypothetical protein